MLRRIRKFALVLMFLAVHAGTVAAQTHADSKFQKECEKATKIISRGNPEKKVEEAFGTLQTCGGAMVSEGLAAGLMTYRNEADVLVLQRFMRQLDSWRDAAVLRAATDLAMNTSASGTARAFAVRHLLVLVNPYMSYAFAGLIGGDTAYTAADGMQITSIGNCGGMLGSERGDRVATPLPADYESRIRATLATLIASPSTPAIVRNAARCGAR